MVKIIINEQVLKDWIDNFIMLNNKSPGLKDLYINKGCPYGKEIILKEYGNLSNLYEKLNINRKELGYDNVSNDQLLKILKEYVIRFRTTDRDILRKNGLCDRSVYERRFNSWSNALELAGIDNSTKVLLTNFDNYKGEDPISFLKEEIGRNNEFTNVQLDIIGKALSVNCDCKLIRKIIRYDVIQRHFKKLSVLLISCGVQPNLTYCSGNSYIAKDGHICDSNLEVEVDNFFFDNNITHEVHVRYPKSKLIGYQDSKFICDFKVNDIYIEVAGLNNDKYINDIERKKKYAEDNYMKLEILYDTKTDSLEGLRVKL